MYGLFSSMNVPLVSYMPVTRDSVKREQIMMVVHEVIKIVMKPLQKRDLKLFVVIKTRKPEYNFFHWLFVDVVYLRVGNCQLCNKLL